MLVHPRDRTDAQVSQASAADRRQAYPNEQLCPNHFSESTHQPHRHWLTTKTYLTRCVLTMSSSTRNTRRLELETKAYTAEEQLKGDRGHDAQVQAAISAAELYMQALRLADNVNDRQRLDKKTKALISKAEELGSVQSSNHSDGATTARSQVGVARPPKSTRELTKREQIILLEGSKLNDVMFKPWTSDPISEDFVLRKAEGPFEDNHDFSLSETQLKHFAAWERPREALARIEHKNTDQALAAPTMSKVGVWDFVQDVAPDCSIVASMCVGTARAERGHPRIFAQIIYPYNHETDQPALSPNGKYILRLNFNGCWRKVEVDDRLPASNSSRVLHVHDRSHPGLLWPAVVEKAYLKVRGGYDFPGSNSGTDLSVIIGWIPQQVFLHDEDLDREALWNELLPALFRGEIMLTLGTGKLGRREQQQL
ncbi:cysteine protease, partial [Elasticomyces elasticus]